MDAFIRLDSKGQWRGKEHESSFQGRAGECFCEGKCNCNGGWEGGVSCYRLHSFRDGEAIEQLRDYWMGVATFKKPEDYEDFQVTIFTGVKVNGIGSSWEDLAECHKTILEVEARSFMSRVIEGYHQYKYEGDLEEDEYIELLANLLEGLMGQCIESENNLPR